MPRTKTQKRFNMAFTEQTAITGAMAALLMTGAFNPAHAMDRTDVKQDVVQTTTEAKSEQPNKAAAKATQAEKSAEQITEQSKPAEQTPEPEAAGELKNQTPKIAKPKFKQREEITDGEQLDPDHVLAGSVMNEIFLGDANAPVTIVEYASLTCSHCKAFHDNTFEELKKTYIDTGKVRFIMRPFPYDKVAARGFLMALCPRPDNYYLVTDAVFKVQDQLFEKDKNPVEVLQNVARQLGMSGDDLKACWGNKELLKDMLDQFDYASKALGVQRTPTFFINGEAVLGAVDLDTMAKVIEKKLGE